MSVVMPFGKYKGREVKDIYNFDSKYLIWLRKQQFMEKFKDITDEIDKLNAPI